MMRPGQDPWDETFEPIVQYFAGTLDDASAERLRETYGWTADGTAVLDSVRAAIRETPDTAINDETIVRRLAEARKQARVSGSVGRAAGSAVVRDKWSRGEGFGRWSLRRTVLGVSALCSLIAFAVWHHAVTAPREIPAQTYIAASGQRLRVTLPDGSHVLLAAESRLVAPQGFSRTSRTVVLSGEAFFDVKVSSHLPFVVRTGNVATHVLGTVFDVRRYASDTAVHIAVMSGKVAVVGRGEPRVLAAGHSVDATDSTISTSTTDNLTSTAWTEGRLVFYDVPVESMLTTIGRWYGYTFQLSDSTLAARRVAATFRLSERAETMNELTQLLGVEMRVKGKTITVVPRRTAKIRGPLPKRGVLIDTLIQTEAGK